MPSPSSFRGKLGDGRSPGASELFAFQMCVYISVPGARSNTSSSQSLARITNPTQQSLMPLRTSLYQHITNVRSSEHLYNILLQVLNGIEGIRVTTEPSELAKTPSVLVAATEVTWSRSARRKKIVLQTSQRTFQGPIIMQSRITCADGPHQIAEKQQISGLHLLYQWIDGSDREVLESFVSHVNRKVTAVV